MGFHCLLCSENFIISNMGSSFSDLEQYLHINQIQNRETNSQLNLNKRPCRDSIHDLFLSGANPWTAGLGYLNIMCLNNDIDSCIHTAHYVPTPLRLLDRCFDTSPVINHPRFTPQPTMWSNFRIVQYTIMPWIVNTLYALYNPESGTHRGLWPKFLMVYYWQNVKSLV